LHQVVVPACVCDNIPVGFLISSAGCCKFSVPFIQFWLGHANASCSAFLQEGGSNATLSLLHCNQFSTCSMNLGQTPLLHRTCIIHSDAKEEMAGAKRKALSTMISSKYSVAFWSLLCMLSKACNSTLQCALVLDGRQVLHMNGSINVRDRYIRLALYANNCHNMSNVM
jgi:hypothetical protein